MMDVCFSMFVFPFFGRFTWRSHSHQPLLGGMVLYNHNHNHNHNRSTRWEERNGWWAFRRFQWMQRGENPPPPPPSRLPIPPSRPCSRLVLEMTKTQSSSWRCLGHGTAILRNGLPPSCGTFSACNPGPTPGSWPPDVLSNLLYRVRV